MTIELPNLNDSGQLYDFVMDLTTRPGAVTEVNSKLDHALESLVLGGNATAITCRRCLELFIARQETDDFGNTTIVGGVRIRGRWVCDSCEYDALVDELAAREPERMWFRLTDSQEHQRDELVDAGFYDQPEPLGLDDLVWNADAARDGGEFL